MKKRKDDTRMRVYGYCRVSTDMQADDGNSLDNQEDQIGRFCKNNNLDLLGVFKEQASGAIHYNNRPLLRHIMRELENGLCDGLVVYKLDRLSRSIKDTIELMSLFGDKGWNFFEIQHGLNTNGAQAKFQIMIFSALAQLERDIIKDRVNEVIAYKKSRNHLLGGVPYGKRVIEKDGVKVLVDDEDEMRIVDRIFELADEDVKHRNGKVKKRSRLDICRCLQRDGFLNKDGGNRFYVSTINRILRNPDDYRRINGEEIDKD